jgi:hypothetical protein
MPAVDPIAWDIEPGEVNKRLDIHRRFGGGRQSGISPSALTKNVLVFSDPETGRKYGYDRHEGRHEDGSYRYTGEGQTGNQSISSSGNAALLSAESRDRSIRLFITQGTDATYIGEYTLGEPSHRIERALDRERNERDVIVFNLVPVSDEASIPVTRRRRTETAVVSSSSLDASPWRPSGETTINVPAIEGVPNDRTITRKEMKLQNAYGIWLIAQNKVVENLPFRLASGVVVRPDLYNKSDGQIIEAKKSNGREYVRTAIGQVLDYQYNLKKLKNIDTKPVILLPACPEQDLVDLCSNLGIGVVFQDGADFQSATASI